MTEMVTGTPSIVGFTDGHRNYGWSEKDQSFAAAIDAGERTRDVLAGQHNDSSHFHRAFSDVIAAVERNGAATSLAVEKIGAASILESAKNSGALGLNIEKTSAATNLNIEKVNAALNLAVEKTSAAAALTACQNQAAMQSQMAACCCELKELVRAENGQTRDLITANTVQDLRDALAAAQRTGNAK